MVPSTVQIESRVDRATHPYTLMPISQDNDITMEQTYEYDEFCGTTWRIVRTILGLVALIILCLNTIPILIESSSTPFPNPSPPRFFLHSLRVSKFNISEGELLTTWNVNLTISNGFNSTSINFLSFMACIVYKEDKALALSAPIRSEDSFATDGAFVMDKNENENKTLHLTFNTTGWESDQPIVDDDVIQEIDEQRQLGVVSFGLKIMVEMEINYNSINVPTSMQPYCSDLEVDLSPLERGEAATLDNVAEPRECLDRADQWYMNNIENQERFD